MDDVFDIHTTNRYITSEEMSMNYVLEHNDTYKKNVMVVPWELFNVIGGKVMSCNWSNEMSNEIVSHDLLHVL